jgi:hypothetical protein
LERGDYFDGIFDTQQSLWQTLQSVLLVGRTRPLQPGAMITFVRDEPKTIPRAGFSPRNMLNNTFSIDYLMFSPNTVTDAIVVQYIDSRTWTQNQVLCALPGSTATLDTAPQLQFLGIVDYDHAWREGIYTVAAGFYRRVFPSFNTELDGRVCFLGDLVRIAHWVASWGIAADAIALEQNEAGDIVTLSEPWSVPEGEVGENLITLASPDGQLYGPVTFNLVDDGSTTAKARVQLTSTATIEGKYAGLGPRDWPVWSGDGLQFERPKVMVGIGDQLPRDALIVSMQPAQNYTATISAVIEDARVHTADTGIPPVDTSAGDGSAPDLTITALTIIEADVVPNNTSQLNIVVTVSGAADAQSFDYEYYWGAGAYGNPITGQARTFRFADSIATLTIRVRPISVSGSGAWFATTFIADGVPDAPVADVGAITATTPWTSGGGGVWQWPAVANATSYEIVVQAKGIGLSGGDFSWTQVRTDTTTLTSYNYTTSMAAADFGGTFDSVRIGVKAANASGDSTDWTYSA